MAQYTEGRITLDFPDAWYVTKYDDWGFYRNQFTTSCKGTKAIDFLAYDQDSGNLWLIELKDYRLGRRSKSTDLIEEIAFKVRDTLADLFIARIDHHHDNYQYAARCSRASRIRVVLHLEQPRNTSKLFPRIYNPADVQQKLRQIIKPIDHHPKVVEIHNMDGLPWTAQ